MRYPASGFLRPSVEEDRAELNRYAAEGWQVVFQVLEMKRFWLFWQREAVIVTLGR